MSNFDKLAEWGKRYYERKRREEEEKKNKKAKNKNEEEKLEGKEIVIPEFKDAFFLEGELGREINERIQGKYGKYDVIKKIEFKDNIVKGSNPFYVCAVQEFAEEHGLRVAVQADLERILKEKKLKLEGHYEDSSLVWRSNQDPNKYLAKDLYGQFKKGGIELKGKSVYVIPLFGLRLREDKNSEHKLAFDLTEKTIYFEAPILNSKSGSYINPSEMNEKIGLPEKVYEKAVSGNRQLWTRNSGLSSLYLYRSGDIGSYGEGLAVSGDVGRVVLIRGEAANAENLGGN